MIKVDQPLLRGYSVQAKEGLFLSVDPVVLLGGWSANRKLSKNGLMGNAVGDFGPGARLTSSLGLEPIRHSFWTKSNGSSDSETGESSGLRIFVNRDRRNSQDGGQLFGSHGAAKSFDPIGQGERLPLARYLLRLLSSSLKSVIID